MPSTTTYLIASLIPRSDWYKAHRYLPVISHLSIGEHAVDEETFQKTLKYIFSFIEKVTISPP